MNKQEVVKLLSIATANFPSYQERNMMPTAELWFMAIGDLDFETAQKALIKVLSTSRFFPVVADIRAAASELTNPRQRDWSEAWGLINQAIKKFGYYRQPEGMASLPPDVREMAERFTWRELCLNENIDTLRAQFRMAWDTVAKRKQELNQLPQPIREMLDGVASGMKLLD